MNTIHIQYPQVTTELFTKYELLNQHASRIRQLRGGCSSAACIIVWLCAAWTTQLRIFNTTLADLVPWRTHYRHAWNKQGVSVKRHILQILDLRRCMDIISGTRMIILSQFVHLQLRGIVQLPVNTLICFLADAWTETLEPPSCRYKKGQFPN